MQFIVRINKALNKQNLEFVDYKEYNEKFKGYLIDKTDNYKIKFEINKALRLDMLTKWCKFCKEHIELHKKVLGGK